MATTPTHTEAVNEAIDALAGLAVPPTGHDSVDRPLSTIPFDLLGNQEVSVQIMRWKWMQSMKTGVLVLNEHQSGRFLDWLRRKYENRERELGRHRVLYFDVLVLNLVCLLAGLDSRAANYA